MSIPDSTLFLNETQNEGSKTSIRKKAQEGIYSKTRSLYPVYNDLKIAFKTQIAQLPIGSKDYQDLTDIFNFSLDLILREGVRFSLLLPDQVLSGELSKTTNGDSAHTGEKHQSNGNATSAASTIRADVAAESEESDEDKDKEEEEGDGEEREEEEYEEDEYEAEALNGFQKIYADVQEQYGEAFYILTQNGPLFTSLNGKSSHDPREYHIPKMFNTTRSLPYTGPSTAYQMSYISSKISPVPHPAIPPTEFMTGFIHPNGVPLPLPTWLDYGVYQSFAPTVDQTNAVLDETVVNSIWFERYTRRSMKSAEAIQDLLSQRIEKDKASKDRSTEPALVDVEGSKEGESKEVESTEGEPKEEKSKAGDDQRIKKDEPEEKIDIEMVDVENEGLTVATNESRADSSEANNVQIAQDLESEDLDFLSTLTWAPDHFIDEDEVEAARTNTEEALISRLLLELQNTQRVRLARADNTAFIITPGERRLATKIQNMLVRVMAETSPKELQLQPSPKYPVLQATYQGVLQVPDTKQTSQGSSGMRPSRYMTRKQRRMM